jgi:hypothetical protein
VVVALFAVVIVEVVILVFERLVVVVRLWSRKEVKVRTKGKASRSQPRPC